MEGSVMTFYSHNEYSKAMATVVLLVNKQQMRGLSEKDERELVELKRRILVYETKTNNNG
ncbi:MAG: hypothetical protein KF744_09240 [Taibaiella sp.]|nr:hypothetical protein [Taibaiella sp.]